VNVSVAPAFRFPVLQVIVVPDSVHEPLPDTITGEMLAGGGLLVSVKVVEPGAVPSLVTVIVYVTVPPAFTVVGFADLLNRKWGFAVTQTVAEVPCPLASRWSS
jgi:hypothetical protein